MSVYKKLSEARAKFHSMKMQKTGHNKFAGYNYFELGDFLVPALSVFREVGLLSVISFGNEVAVMRIIDIDKPDDFILIESPMSKAQLKGAHEIQNLGAVQTYIRRYLWVTAMEIVEHDALDSSKPLEEKKVVHAPTGTPIVNGARLGVIQAVAEAIKEHHANDDMAGAFEEYEGITDEEERVALWKLLPSNVRSDIKKFGQSVAA